VKMTCQMTYDECERAMLSYERLFDYNNSMYVYGRMMSYANAAYEGQQTNGGDQARIALLARADKWMTDLATVSIASKIYLENFIADRVKYVHDQEVYAFAIGAIVRKRFNKYVKIYDSNEITRLLNSRTSEMYKPEMWGKDSDISIESPSEWTYFLKAKCAFKPRRMPLLETMRNDLKIYLTQKNITINDERSYAMFISSIVNAFIPNQMDMYAQNMLSSKHIESGINKYNDCLNGKLARSTKMPDERELKLQASTII
jgi:hypothetical protein